MKRLRYLLAWAAFIAVLSLAIHVEGKADASPTLGDWSYSGIVCIKANKGTRVPGVTCARADGQGYAILINKSFIGVFKLGGKHLVVVYTKSQQ